MPEENDSPSDSAIPVRADGSEPPVIEEVARLFSTYEVVRFLERGDIGAVYQARQTTLDRLVAIKVLPLEMSVDEAFAERFRKEARAMAKLSHPNIVAVYDFGTTPEGQLFIIMEYVEGATLRDIVHRPTEAVAGITDPDFQLAPEQALSIVEQICAALGYAHAHGIVHRGLKPAKVMIDTEGQVKVTDFGLSTRPGAGSDTTVVVAPGYMAPEELRGTDADRRADIYRLGVMLYEMLCREVPTGAFPPPSARTGCDARIDAIVVQAIQQAPEQRYQTAQEMQSAVAAARVALTDPPPLLPDSDGLAPGPPRAQLPPRGPTTSKLPRYAVLIVVAAALAWAYAHFTKPANRADSAEGKITPSAPTITPAPTNLKSATPSPIDSGPLDAKVANAAGPEKPSSENPAASSQPQSAMEKWLADVDGPRQAMFQKLAAEPFVADMEKLRTRYLAALAAGQAKAAATANLDEAVVWLNERKLLEQAPSAPPAYQAAPSAIGSLRADYRQRLAQLERGRATRAQPLCASYDAILLQNLTLLTRRGRIADAQLLENKRGEIARTWVEAPVTEQLPDTLRWFAKAIALRPLEPGAGGW
ncbi:MAG: serine/threonine-protein kinase, partial [Chthoniobacteraceae bacterium]